MAVLGSLSPLERRLVTVGAPVAVVLGLGAAIRRKKNAAAEDATTPPAPPVGYTLPAMPSTDAIGTGQLADFESGLTQSINDLWERIEQKTTPVVAAPVPVPVSAPVPPPATAPAPAPVPAPPPAPATRTYTVVRGDSLWAIAARFYGNGARWPVIYDANRAVIGGNPNLIRPGQTLVVP